MTQEQRLYYTLFRLEGLRTDWCVYWVIWQEHCLEEQLQECRADPRSWDYFREETCNLLDEDMQAVLKELQNGHDADAR